MEQYAIYGSCRNETAFLAWFAKYIIILEIYLFGLLIFLIQKFDQYW